MRQVTIPRIFKVQQAIYGILPAIETLEGANPNIILTYVNVKSASLWMKKVLFLLNTDGIEEKPEANEEEVGSAELDFPANKTTDLQKIGYLLEVMSDVEKELAYLSKLDSNFFNAILNRDKELNHAFSNAYTFFATALLFVGEAFDTVSKKQIPSQNSVNTESEEKEEGAISMKKTEEPEAKQETDAKQEPEKQEAAPQDLPPVQENVDAKDAKANDGMAQNADAAATKQPADAGAEQATGGTVNTRVD